MMTATKLNKLKNLLSTMEEETNSTQKTSTNNSGSKKKNYLPFFNPNKMFVGRNEVIVRILPNQDDFYYQFKKHMVSLGVGNFKQVLCMHSEDENGNKLDNKCPLCDFIEAHSSELDKQIAWQLSAKDVFMMFVYNPYAKQIQRYEVQQKGMIDITRAVVDLIDETDNNFDPNNEGFDAVFKMDGKYPKCVKAIVPKTSVVDTLNEATNKEDVINDDFEIKPFMLEIMPYAKSTTERFINTTVQTIVGGMCPGYDIDEYLFEDKSSEFNPQQFNNYSSKTTENNGYTEEPEEDDYEPVRNRRGDIVTEEYSYTDEVENNIAPNNSTSDDEPITDIRSFLNRRNNK